MLGRLLETHWELQEIELGINDKVYDTLTGQYFFERKIIKVKIGGIIDVQWIKERVEEQAMLTRLEEVKSIEETLEECPEGQKS